MYYFFHSYWQCFLSLDKKKYEKGALSSNLKELWKSLGEGALGILLVQVI